MACETTYTPQGDGNVNHEIGSVIRKSETTYTPQGDGSVAEDQLELLHFGKQLTPRKGTEATFSSLSFPALFGNNLHPARGRKRVCTSSAVIVHVEKQLTPRKGTET